MKTKDILWLRAQAICDELVSCVGTTPLHLGGLLHRIYQEAQDWELRHCCRAALNRMYSSPVSGVHAIAFGAAMAWNRQNPEQAVRDMASRIVRMMKERCPEELVDHPVWEQLETLLPEAAALYRSSLC